MPASHAQELPTGGTVTHGNATISGSGSSLLINQTSGSAIVSWDTFSVGAGGTTHFNNGAGATLNRVGGNVPSSIDGSLTATGSLYLVNPAGVTVGTGGVVATGGTFAASTHDVADGDFLDGGDTVFAGSSMAQIINHGTISSAMGDVALIARRVENTGDISAPNGTAALLAGYDVLMHETTGPNGKFAVRVGGSDTEAVNTGTINAAEAELRANGGNVLALAGNTRGVVKATGVARSGGRIFLTAGGGKVQTSGRVTARRRVSSGSTQQSGGEVFINADTVLASGHIDVSGLGAAGGNIDIGGRDIALTSATLDASGDTGGGRIRVGGAFQGGDFGEATTADSTSIDADTLLVAAATDSGNGGELVVWGTDSVRFHGTINTLGGDGGSVEVSTKGTGVIDGDARTLNLLIDPGDVCITTAGTSGCAAGAVEVASSALTSVLNAGGTATVNTDVAGTSGTGRVDFGGGGNIAVNNNTGTMGTFIIHAADTIHTQQVGFLSNGTTGTNYEWYAGSTSTGTPVASADIVQGGQVFNSGGGHVIRDAADDISINDPLRTGGGAVTLIARGGDGGSTVTIGEFGNTADDHIDTTDGAGNAGIVTITSDNVAFSGTADPVIDADGVGGEIIFARSSNGTISVGDDNGGLVISQAMLDVMQAPSIAFGGTTTAAGVTVDNADLSAFDATGITTASGGSVTFSGVNTSAAMTTQSASLTIGGTVTSGGSDLSFATDEAAINAAVNAGAGVVSIQNASAGRTIDMGTETAGSLSLTDAELDFITAGMLRIGSAGAGSISITNSISPANTSILSLTTGDQILDDHNLNAADIVVANLALRAVNGIADNDGLDTEVETLAVLNTTDNSVSVLERSSGGSLTIGTVDGLTGVVNQGSGPHPGQRSIQIETNDGDLTVAAGSEVTSSHGGIYLVAQHQNGGTGDRLFTNNGAITMEGGNGRIEIIANNMNLGSVAGGSSISSLNGSRIVLSDDPSSLSTIAINLGGADGVNTLGLTQTELATVSTSGVLQIGHAGSGDITASGAIDFDAANVETLSLQTGGAVLDGNQITFDPITVANLAIRAGNGIGSAADDLDLVVSNLAFSNAAGVVNVENAAPLTIAAVDGLSNSDNSGTTTTLIAGLGILQALNIDVDISSAGAALFTGDSIVVGSDVDITAASADFDADSIALNGNGVTTAGDQDYRGAVTLGADNVLTSSASGAINFESTVDGGSGLTVNTAGNTTFVGAVGGTTQLAGLTTDAGGTTFVNGGLVATTGTQTFNDQVSVAGTVFASTGGSLTFGAGITTTLPDSSLWLLAADDIDIGGDVQWDGTGDVTLVAGWNAATDGSTGWTIGSTTADTTLLDDAGNFGQGTGDISIGTTAQTAGVSVGSRDGTTTALAQNMYLASSTSDDGYAQLGFRGAATGDIAVVLTEDLTTLTGAGLRSFVQIGHGGHNDDNDHSGDISIDVGEGVLLSGGGNTQSYGLFGHGGYGSDGAKSGAIDLTIGGILTVSGGAGTDAFAQIGHGDISGNSSGTRMGDISAIVGGRTNFTTSSGSYWFGHATSTGGGISNANVALVTNGLSFAGLAPATGPTAASGDFAQMIRNNLTGGDVLIANRLAQIVDADSGNPDYLDDIIFFGADADYVVESDNSIFFAATGEVSFEHGLQIDGTGGINLVAGWDGTTGLDLTGVPALSMTDIEAAGAFGSSTGSEGDNGDINIREFNPTGRILVGSWMGDIHALAHDLEVTAGPADSAESRLGAWPQANVDIDSDIRIVVKDDVLVVGGGGDRSIAAIGHGFGDGFGNVSGDITILGENDANDNEIVVAGGDGEFSVARIGHDSLGGEAHGYILLRGEDISVEGGSDDDAFAQIGHIGELVTGKLDIEATNDLEVLGGSDDDAHAQIGHKSASAAGDLTVTVGGNLAIIGGDDEFTFAQIGHIGETATGSIDIDVAGLAILLGGFDEVADAQIGHDAEDLASGAIDFTVGGPLIIAALTEDAFAYVGHSGGTNATGNITVDVGGSLIMGTIGEDTVAQIGHIADADNTGDTTVDVDGAIFLGNVADGSYSKIGHGNWNSDGALAGNIDVTSVGPIMLYGGLFGDSFAQFGHGDPFGFSGGTRQGDITVITDGEMTLDDGLAGGSLAWIGHGTGTAGGVSDANVFLQAFGFDRDLLSTVPAGDLGRFNKDILEADIVSGDFTLIATGTGLLVEDPIYNSPFQVLMSVNNDMVLDTNAIFVNSGTGDIILAAGGDFHNDTGTLTPFTTGGRWLVYSTRPDNNRNDLEITNWDFLRYSTTFDLNNPLVGTGNGLVYSVTPVVNFTVSDETIAFGQTPAPTLSQILAVNGISVDPLAFGLGINPATADTAIATSVVLNGFGNPLPGFYSGGLTTQNEFLPYFGMAFTIDPGDLTVTGTTTPTTGNPISTSTNSGVGGMCAFRSDDEDPEEEGPAFDRIIELCGIIESDRD